MNHFHSLRNNQENYTVAENEEYQTVEPFSMPDIVKNYVQKNANESYYFLFYTGIFIILISIIIYVCTKPGLIIPSELEPKYRRYLKFGFIFLFYLGAIYYYTHISIFYFSESWERYTFIGYGTVLFIIFVVYVGIFGKKFAENNLGPLLDAAKKQQAKKKLNEQLIKKVKQLERTKEKQGAKRQAKQTQEQAERKAEQAFQQAKRKAKQTIQQAKFDQELANLKLNSQRKKAKLDTQLGPEAKLIQKNLQQEIGKNLQNILQQEKQLQQLKRRQQSSSPSLTL